jgi:hypothetical protein
VCVWGVCGSIIDASIQKSDAVCMCGCAGRLRRSIVVMVKSAHKPKWLVVS